jgi:hypothetical protein
MRSFILPYQRFMEDNMLASFFSFGNRKYINNAVVTADILTYIFRTYGDVTDFRIHFRKPFFSQGELIVAPYKLEGHYVGQFATDGVLMYFAYTPTSMPLEEKTISVDDIQQGVNVFTLCYYVAENCHQAVLRAFETHYGPRTSDDKSIFVIYEIPDTSVFTKIIKENRIPVLSITEPELTADRKFKLSVSVDGQLLGYRYNTVKKFIL